VDILPLQQFVASANTVFNGQHGDITRQARLRQLHRQTLYRQAEHIARALDDSHHRTQREQLRQQLRLAQQLIHDLQRQHWRRPELSDDRLAHFAATAQAEGVSLPCARRLLEVFLAQHTPSVARLGRWTQQAGQQAAARLTVLDEHSRRLVRQAAADEIFVGRRPILMVVEPDSLCWQTGQLAEQRDGATWANVLGKLPSLEQLIRDGGTGLAKGVEQVNAARCAASLPVVADQLDHFHLLREGTRALRRLHGQATHALERAEHAEALVARRQRQGQSRAGVASVAARRWREAEAVFTRWSAQEHAWQRLRDGVQLFTPTGELNTRTQATETVAAVVPELDGPEWSKVRRQVVRPEVLAYLERAQEQLAAVAGPPDVKALLVHAEGLAQRPAAVAVEGSKAGALRGVLLATAVVLSLGGAAMTQVQAGIRAALRSAWRASSLVEGLNSVLRMQQARHRGVTQGLLDLKRLYWNSRRFRTGQRRKHTPYELLGLKLPEEDWWNLLKRSPEQLRQELSASEKAA
jgi:hypothetical protein